MSALQFRAYIKGEKRFIYCDDSEENYLGTFFTALRQIEKLSGEKVPIDEYIGVKDKHGQEIYEGDIVQAGKHRGAVIREEYYWTVTNFHDPYNEGIHPFAYSYMEWEVIGNVREHPHLLGAMSRIVSETSLLALFVPFNKRFYYDWILRHA